MYIYERSGACLGEERRLATEGEKGLHQAQVTLLGETWKNSPTYLLA